MPTTNGEQKSVYMSQEALNFGYENSYANYPAITTATTITQPLPGQPPLPPMPSAINLPPPPPTAAVPPPPHMFAQVPSQV